MLVGEGAGLFANEIGQKKEVLLHPEALKDYKNMLKERGLTTGRNGSPEGSLINAVWRMSDEPANHGTGCIIVRTSDGNMAGGVSTSGWAYKYPGRLGDAPIIGAGLYVDNRYGTAACTHIGEMAIRCSTARSVVLYLKKGASVEEACLEAVDDLRGLNSGFIGPVVIHAMDRHGVTCVLSSGQPDDVSYWIWSDGMNTAECRTAVCLAQAQLSK